MLTIIFFSPFSSLRQDCDPAQSCTLRFLPCGISSHSSALDPVLGVNVCDAPSARNQRHLFLFFLLKRVFQRELNQSGIDRRAGDFPEGRRSRHAHPRIAELWMVEGIEEFRAELQCGTFP